MFYRSQEFDAPRTFTMNQISDLVHVYLLRSDLKKSFDSQSELVQIHDESLKEISEYRAQLGEDLKNEFDDCSKEIENTNIVLQDYK